MLLWKDNTGEDNKSIVKTFLFLIIIENSSTRGTWKKHAFYYKNKFFQPRKNIGLKGMRYQNFVFLILLGKIPLEFVSE